MARPGGQWLAALTGIALVAAGAGLAAYGLRKKFVRHLAMAQTSARTRKVA